MKSKAQTRVSSELTNKGWRLEAVHNQPPVVNWGMRKRYPSDISQEAKRSGHYWKACVSERNRGRLIYMKSSAVCCICSRAAANGGCCPVNSPSGERYTPTSPSGASLVRTASAF